MVLVQHFENQFFFLKADVCTTCKNKENPHEYKLGILSFSASINIWWVNLTTTTFPQLKTKRFIIFLGFTSA